MEDGGEMNVQPKYNEAIHEAKIDLICLYGAIIPSDLV
jgi:hypothetical protein